MTRTSRPVPVYSGTKVLEDMAARGIDVMRLAGRTRLHHGTIRRFLSGDAQTIKTATAIAKALGRSPRRYLVGVMQEGAGR